MEGKVDLYSMTFKNKAAAENEEKDVTDPSEEKPKEPKSAVPKAEAAKKSPTLLLLVCSGTLCVVLVAVIIFLSVSITYKQQATINDLTAKNEQLNLEKKNLVNLTEGLQNEKTTLQNLTESLKNETRTLQNLTESLKNKTRTLQNLTDSLKNETRTLQNLTESLKNETRTLQNLTESLKNETKILENQRNGLNWTLGFILTFNSFPVNMFCPNKTCQPCQTGWIQFKEKCYLFYNESTWKNWTQSRLDCQSRSSDLVVVNDLQEQQFISNNSQYYYDEWHGYMLGLRQVNNSKWIWVDGHEDTLGFWIPGDYGGVSGPGVQLIPSEKKNLTANWDQTADVFQAKFICEQDVLIRSS